MGITRGVVPQDGDWDSAEAHDVDNTDAFVVNDPGGDLHSYHTGGLAATLLDGWTFDAGGAGTSFPIAAISDGVDTGVDINVETTGSHLLAVGDIVSHTNLADAAYVGLFVVKAVIDATNYEVAAVYTATGTGTTEHAAVLICGSGAAGLYHLQVTINATSATNDETIDFQIMQGVTVITGTKVRHKFGTAADFSNLSISALVSVAALDKISLALANQDTAGNLTIRNLNINLTRA